MNIFDIGDYWQLASIIVLFFISLLEFENDSSRHGGLSKKSKILIVFILLSFISAFFSTIYKVKSDFEKYKVHTDTTRIILDSVNENLKRSNKIILSGEITLNKVDSSLRKVDSSLNLNEEVKKLSILNNSIGHKTNKLINVVQTLTKRSNEVIDDVALRTEEEFAVTGLFNFKIDTTEFENFSGIDVYYGGVAAKNYNKLEIMTIKNIDFGLGEYLHIYLNKDSLDVNMKLYDLEHNLILESEQNYWRINKNKIGKFNYDSSGLEIFDNRGTLVFNIDIKRGIIQVKGIVPLNYSKVMVMANGEHQTLQYGTDSLNKLVNRAFSDLQRTQPILPLFKYTGPKWHGVRLRGK